METTRFALLRPRPACLPAADSCRGLGAHQALVATLLFDRTAQSDRAWSDFLRTIITPRFPDGLTVLDGSGQFHDRQTGAIGSEASLIVIIATENGRRTGFKLAKIASEYTSRFHQQSVGILLAPTCAAF
ncbi:MAG: DUF3574 domain-containing protein [Alphaproteobacteria bacterium]|nr:DUF3574 domain-containing protein [Alphaproteobacteria bacterium]